MSAAEYANGAAGGGITRGAFLARTAMATAATLGAAAAGPLVREALAQESGGDVDQMNFLLQIHRVESQMYEQALSEVDLSRDSRRAVEAFADHEREHVELVELLLRRSGGRAEEEPQVDFGERLRNERAFLLVANDVEEVASFAGSVTARRIASKDVLAEVAKILQVDARHSAWARVQLGRLPSQSAFEGTLSRDEARQRLRRFVL